MSLDIAFLPLWKGTHPTHAASLQRQPANLAVTKGSRVATMGLLMSEPIHCHIDSSMFMSLQAEDLTSFLRHCGAFF